MHIRFIASVILAVMSVSSLTFGQCDFGWKPVGSGMDDAVRALTVYNGELIAGGSFTSAGGVDANCIARWDGSSWQPLGSGITGGYYTSSTNVSALTVYNGELIAGGDFNNDGHVDANCIARWDGNSWRPLGSGMSGLSWLGGWPVVNALTVYNGELIAGGRFVKAGGVDANMIARWDGNNWQPLGSGMRGAGWEEFPEVCALTVYNGELVAGGSFTKAGETDVNRIARWDGDSWQPMGDGMNSTALALTVYDGNLIAGGSFVKAGGVDANRIGRWDGSNWHLLGNGTNSGVVALTVYDGELIAGGGFTIIGGVGANRIGRWNGSNWQPLDNGMNSWVGALTVYNGELIAGGFFTTAGGMPSMYWARWGVEQPIEGDLNHDCEVDLTDFTLFAQQWRNSDCLYDGWCYEADLNYDFKVDFEDFTRLADNWLAGP